MQTVNKHLFSLIFIILIVPITKAQTSKIELPLGIEEIKVNYTSPIISIYVDKENAVYLEEEQIEISELGKRLSYIRYKLPIEDIVFTKVFLYIDKVVPYKIIDKIKTEIASVYMYNTYYKTGSVEDKDLLKGLGFRNHQSFFRYQHIEKKTTKKQEEEDRRYNDSIRRINEETEMGFLLPPPPPPMHWTAEFKHKLYSDQQEIIDEILEGKSYSCVSIGNNGIKIEKELINFDDLEDIEKVFLNNDVLLVNFDDNLVYKNYFKMINIVRKLERKNKERHIPLFAEISSEIKGIHQKSGIKFCN
ncbi:biopolymer transporter ExbD [Pontimicrobium sp. SW4]|uniref:Biopolymer transporter ExbD n=1 Tax=Pontimicrobium sp. SW4 TaxID=3153519 RepID=A0AAU7BTE3_9FLAO